MPDEVKTPVEGQSEVAETTSVNPGTGVTVTTQEAPVQDKFEGKSAEEIASAYKALETKLGEQSKEVGQTRAQLAELQNTQQQLNYILSVIGNDPKLYKEVDTAVRKSAGQGVQESQSFVPDDTRRALESQIINDFRARKGITTLPTDQQKDLDTKIGAVLLDVLDPGGRKTVPQVLNEVSLQKLPRLMEYAYTIVSSPQVIEQAKAQALAEKEAAEAGAIGGIPSTGGSTTEISLTREEREIAKKMGMAPDKYLAGKKKSLNNQGE